MATDELLIRKDAQSEQQKGEEEEAKSVDK